MLLSDVIKELQLIKNKFGDIPLTINDYTDSNLIVKRVTTYNDDINDNDNIAILIHENSTI